ncbi:MAG: glycosyltransferase [Candidatus Aenigmarchaeota archaeon]
MIWTIVLNYLAWYIFVFMGVVWILVLFQNRDRVSEKVPDPSKLPPVSVILPAYNEEKTLARSIRSILGLNYPRKLLDIVVVNDCSTDRTGKIADSFKKLGVRVLHNRVNKGKAYSLNRGIGIARHEFIATVDADSIVEADIIQKMVGYFSDPEVASVTPALKVWKHGGILEKIQHAEYLLNVFLRKILSFLDSIHVTPGVFSMYRKSVILEIGGFDEGNLTEDLEVALNIHRHGYKIENNHNACSYTLCPRKWKQLFRQRIRWYRGAIQNTIKHRHMYFNPKFGNLGVFFLPANILSVAAIIVLFFVMAWNWINSTFSYFWRMSMINWDFSVYFSSFDAIAMLSSMITTPLLFGTIGLALGCYVLYVSFKVCSSKVRGNKLGYALYLVFFPMVLMAFWTLAFLYEIFGLKRSW